MNAYERFMQEMAQPMRDDLTSAGFKELRTAEEVEQTMNELAGTALIVINSVCGCAAGQARPAAKEAIQEVMPDHLLTVFAGKDREATDAMRKRFGEIPPSSPSMAIWKDGQVAYFIPREQIEDFDKETIKTHLVGVLQQVIG